MAKPVDDSTSPRWDCLEGPIVKGGLPKEEASKPYRYPAAYALTKDEAQQACDNLNDRYGLKKEEVRTVSSTGGEKGAKPEKMSMLPTFSLKAIAKVFGFGASKYARDNWRKGYDWSLSYDALQRHLSAWWDSENEYDEESGLSHLWHAGWHILVLIWFAEHWKTFDDRPKQP